MSVKCGRALVVVVVVAFFSLLTGAAEGMTWAITVVSPLPPLSPREKEGFFMMVLRKDVILVRALLVYPLLPYA